MGIGGDDVSPSISALLPAYRSQHVLMKDLTQPQRILAVLQSVQRGDHDIPEEYIRRHPTGDGLSGRYMKRVMFLSECNARMSEMNTAHRALHGVDLIETSEKSRDEHGFAFHRLKPGGLVLSPIAAAAERCRRFDLELPSEQVFAI